MFYFPQTCSTHLLFSTPYSTPSYSYLTIFYLLGSNTILYSLYILHVRSWLYFRNLLCSCTWFWYDLYFTTFEIPESPYFQYMLFLTFNYLSVIRTPYFPTNVVITHYLSYTFMLLLHLTISIFVITWIACFLSTRLYVFHFVTYSSPVHLTPFFIRLITSDTTAFITCYV